MNAPRSPASDHHAAGEAHLAESRWQEAQAEFEAAARLNPHSAEARLGLAVAHRRLEQWAEAERAARDALQRRPRYVQAAHFLGALLVEVDRLPEALAYLQMAADWAPEVAQHHRDLGVTQLFLGDVDGARARLKRTLDLDVHAHEVLYTLIRMRPMGDGSAEAQQLLALVRDLADQAEELPIDERAQVLFSLGKAYEDRREFDLAASVFARANAVKRASLVYDVAETEAYYRQLADVFDKALMARLAGRGDPSNRPIFIVGMPRCGSTLVEQILASHPDVHGAGEAIAMPRMLQASRGRDGSSFPEWAREMNAVDCAALGGVYLGELATGGKPRTADKWLENLENLGIVGVCLPNAPIIHCRRDPRDQLLSCWSLLFSFQQPYAYDQAELLRYYRAYERLMDHWRAVLPPGRMLELRYEDLVAEPEAQSRRILDHCGLGWDDRVLRFWEGRRMVKSASMAQVREPIYDRSIGRWRPFAAHLPELFAPFGDA